MFKTIYKFLNNVFIFKEDLPIVYEPYKEATIMETIKPVRKRASRKKAATMAVYKNKKKNN
jgi:hypothetical protein